MIRAWLIAALALAQIPSETPHPMIVERFDLYTGAQLSPTGQYTHGRDWAAYEWRTDAPEYEGHPLIVDLGAQQLGLAVYCEGAFTDGLTPVRWAYVRYYPEQWDGIRWTLPDGSVPDTAAPGGGVHIDAVAAQQLVDILKRSFSTARIQDFLDASPYDEPDIGAPLAR